MDRRELLKTGAATVAAVSAAGLFSTPARAQITKPIFPDLNSKAHLTTYTRTLHWLRKPDEVAKAVLEIGTKSVDLTIRPGSGHVQPDKVKTELPAFVKGLRDNGVEVTMLAPNILDATDQYAEETLDVAAQLGIKYYWWGTYNYDQTKPYWEQLEALKPKVDAVVKLNAKYGFKGIAHPRSGLGSVSASFFDLLSIMKNHDPRYIGYQYDTQHLLQAYDAGWVTQLRFGGPYIGGFVWKDMIIERADAPNPDDAVRARDAAARAAMAPPAAEGAAAGGRGAGAAGGAPGAGRGAGGGGRGGAGGAANPWPSKQRIRHAPIGTGMVNLGLIAQTLKEIGFNGPMEIEPEWPGIGGAEGGQTTLTISNAEAMAILKRECTNMTAIMTKAGLV